MRILAFHAGPHDATAAAFEDYRLLAAVQDERLTRRKGSGDGVPVLAIDEVLRITGWARTDVEAIATARGFFPGQYLRHPLHKEIDYAFRRWRGTETPLRDLFVVCRQHRTTDTRSVFRTERFLREHGFRADTPIHFANHHESHALAPLFFTDWDEALLYTADGIGDNVSFSIRSLRDGRLECHYGDDRWLLERHPARSSLGWAYGFATEACGFRKLRHEGKLTGLAAYGEPKLAAEIGRLFRVDGNGMVVADFRSEPEVGRAIFRICKGASRETIAASIQQVVEDLTVASVRHWLEMTGARRLGLAGGLFANVRLNRLLAESCPVEEVFVFPAMGDDGISVGAGLSFLLARDGLKRWLAQRRRLSDVYLGRDYNGAIDDQLGEAADIRRVPGEPAKVATDLLVAGKAGAAYIGRMEYGPRALGARSIIASPADAGINDSLNRRLERSEFMPFAPFVLEEDADSVFDITPVNRYTAHFMTITCAVKPEWRKRIPAVVHVDGTARPQIVRGPENPLYADILRRFKAATGLPVLVNTSFNVHEEPIVNRPSECLRALRDGRIDFVVTERGVYVAEPATAIGSSTGTEAVTAMPSGVMAQR